MAFIVSYTINAQENNYKCYLKNATQISKNQMTFDVWLKWESNSNIKFKGIQLGIDFDYDGIANGGLLSTEIVSNSSQVKIINNETNKIGIKIDDISKQLRIVSFVFPTKNMSPLPTDFRIATFKITNTVPFTTDSKPSFSWYEGNADGTHSRNIILGSTQTNMVIIVTNLMNHMIEKPSFVLNPSTIENGLIAVQEQDLIHFHAGDLEEGETTISLFDLMGRHVKNASVLIYPNQYDFDMNIETLSGGIYIVKVNNNKKSYTTKLQLK